MYADSDPNDHISPGQVNNEANKSQESEIDNNMAEHEEIENDLSSKDIPAVMLKGSNQHLKDIHVVV